MYWMCYSIWYTDVLTFYNGLENNFTKVFCADDKILGAIDSSLSQSIRDDSKWTTSNTDPNITSESTAFLATVHPVIKNITINTNPANELVNLNDDYVKLIRPQNNVKIPLNIYYKI